MSKTEEKKYMLDPEEAGVVLDTSGNPTSKGWEVVTPGTWKFRWNFADKVQVGGPGDSDVAEYSHYFRDPEWYVDVTKELVSWEVWKEDPNRSLVNLSAEATTRYLDEMNLVIRPYETLLGGGFNDEHAIRWSSTAHSTITLERAAAQAGKDKICTWTGGKKHSLDEEEWGHLMEFAGAFNTALLNKEDMTEEEWRMYYNPEHPAWFFEPVGSRGLRCNPDHEWYLNNGLRALVDSVRERLDRYNKELKNEEKHPESLAKEIEALKNKIDNAKAQIQVGEAVIRWIKRYAEKVREAAPSMPDKGSREIAEKLGDICDWVAENPPRDFWESMQLHWFMFMTSWSIELHSYTVSYLPDRVHWEYYKKSVMDEKTISRTRACEIIACYASKYAEGAAHLASRFGGVEKGGMGLRDGSVLTMAGQDAKGKDAFNELTHAFLDAFDGYRLHFPDIKIRWHHGMDKKDLRRALEVSRTGMGLPSVRSDDIAIPSLMDMYPDEISLEDARSWAVVGCNTPGPTTTSKGVSRNDSYYPNVLKAVEFTLNNGKDPAPGFEWFKTVDTGDPKDFKDFEDFYQAWLKQWEWIVTTEIRLRNKANNRLGTTCRRPLASLLYRGCQETGEDLVEFNRNMPLCSFQSIVGWVDTIDSLAAVKYCVYDKKMYTMDELLTALKAEWEGYDTMRADFKDAPKFGNDIDFVDDIMVRATEDIYVIHRDKVLDTRGKPTFVNALPLTLIWMVAPMVSALPNGRKRGEVLADSGIAPHADFDKSGPFARIRSALKVDQTKFKAYIYNMKWDYNTVAGEAGLDKLTDYTWSALTAGQSQLQYNFLSTEILRAAQKEPEKHTNLAVRISGWSAYFVPLPGPMQDAVIERAEHQI